MKLRAFLSSLVATAAALAVLFASRPAGAALFPTGIREGSFASGSLHGFRTDALEDGVADLVRQGTGFSGVPGSDEIPFPNGPGSWAVRLRSAGEERAGSVGILTSPPFVPGAPELRFETLSEADAVRLEVLFLDPAADILVPGPGDVLGRVEIPPGHTGTGASARFRTVAIPFPDGGERPVKIQFRQQTLEANRGHFTLITNVRAGEPGSEPDRDGDGVADALDDCPDVADAHQTNSDGDRFGDVCDVCPYLKSNDQSDRDGDGRGDRCTLDLDRDGFTDESDLALLVAAEGGDGREGGDLDGNGVVDLVDLALFAQQLHVGIGSDDEGEESAPWDFSFAFYDHSLSGGYGMVVPRGMTISVAPRSDLIAFPGPLALLVRSGETGRVEEEGRMTSLPFVPTGPKLTLSVLSENEAVDARVRVLRPTRTPRAPVPAEVLLDVPLRNDAPGGGPGARFVEQTLDISPWFDAAHPLRSPPIQIQVSQHTRRPGFAYYTLIGDVRTGS